MCEQAVEALVPELRSPSGSVRELAAYVLESFAWRPADARQQLALDIATYRWEAIRARDPTAVQMLVEMLVDDKNRVLFQDQLDKLDPNWRRSPAAQAAIPFLADPGGAAGRRTEPPIGGGPRSG